MENPRVVVLGAGAIGSLFGGLLTRSGLDVTLVGRPAHVTAIRKRGLRIEGLTRATVRPRAATRPPEGDLVLLAVKSYDTARAVRSIRLSHRGAVLTLQNGVGNAEQVAARFGPRRTLAGVTSCGALLAGPGRVVRTGNGPTVIGEWKRPATVPAREMVALLNRAGIPAAVSRDIRAELWRKLVVNAAINPLTALTGLPNRAVAESPGLRALAAAVVGEATRVARARPISLGPDSLGRVLEVARKTGANRSSMLRDVEHGRRTEIEAITGALLREAERAGVEAPVNRVLYDLMKSLELRSKSAPPAGERTPERKKDKPRS